MENDFTKIASYQYSSEAIITKGKLEAEGIEVFMTDNFTVDSDPLVSNAIGGVKLFVRAEDLLKTNEILAEISRYSIDDSGHLVICLNCGNNTVNVFTTVKDRKALFAFLLTFFIGGGLPIYTKYKYRCNNCGHEFEIK